MGGAEVQIRSSKTTIIGSVNIRPLSCDTDHPDICDRSSRILGIIAGNLAQLQQRPVSNELLIQLRNSGADIDPRQIRLLTCSDQIDVCDRANRQLGIAGRNWTLNSATDSITVVNVSFPMAPISDFNQAPGVGSYSSSTHTYTATGNFKLSTIEASASGAMKIEIKVGTTNLETTRMIAFTTESNLTTQLKFHEQIQLTVGQRIQVIRTNRELQAMDVFSTILGFNT